MSLCPEEGKNFLKRYDQAGKAKWLILVIAAGILLLGVILYAGGRWLETRSVEEARGDLTQIFCGGGKNEKTWRKTLTNS